LYAPLYNTDIIDEPPTSWADLLDARFTGEIMIADPTEANASSQFLSALMHDGAIDEAWLTSLVEDQDLVLGPPSSSGSVNSIVTGESGLLVGIGAKHYLNAKGSGAPVGFATGLEEGHYMLGYGVALLKDAPHPAAAKLVETWLLSTEGQEGVAATNDYGTMPGAPAPEGLPDMSSFNVILNPAPDEMDKVYPTHLALFQQLMR
ncbi:MAG: ABC transporter substrate-binding protein, partial [Microbacterium sp.]